MQRSAATNPRASLAAKFAASTFVLAAFALGALGLTNSGCVEADPVDLTEQDVQLTVFHTADWHSRLVPYTYDPPAPVEQQGLRPENAPFGGIDRLATLIETERAKTQRHITVDTGDCFQGAPIFNLFGGEPEIRMQSYVGIDAAVIGNHEFDLGVTNYVSQYRKFGNFPALAANYELEDPLLAGNSPLGDIAEPFTIRDIGGLKVLIIGLGNLSSLNSINEGGNSIGARPLEANWITQYWINHWAPYVDVIGVITHLGIEFDIGLVEGYTRFVPAAEGLPKHEECSIVPGTDGEMYACKVPGVRGIDFIMGGHFHIVLNPPRTAIDNAGRTVPIVHSGAFMQFLGRMDTVFRHASRMGRDDWYGFELADFRYKPIPIDSTIEPDPQALLIMEPYLWDLGLNDDLSRPVAFTPTGVTRSSASGGDSAMGNVVAGSIQTRNRVESEFALTNSAGIRDNFPPGIITQEMLFNVFPFENTITTFFLSGREVKEVFDFVASRSAGRGCRSQVQVSGVEFTIRCDCRENPEEGCCPDARGFDEFPKACAEDIVIGGATLNLNTRYEVGANDYMARGGSGFRMLRKNTTQQDSGISLRDAVVEFLQKFPPCTVEQVASMGNCQRDVAPDSAACQYEDVTEAYGDDIPCVTESGLVDGRIKRVVPQ